MSKWVIKGISTGIKTTDYPRTEERASGITPGLPAGCTFSSETADELVKRCPVDALSSKNGSVSVNYKRCIHCYRCIKGKSTPLKWNNSYEWASNSDEKESLNKLGKSFKGSAHVLVVDAGDCGACLNEVKQLNSPYYNMHRLGFFVTPSPRHADILMVVGPVTENIKHTLLKAYDAMPTPKSVIAIGACALSGGLFTDSFVCENGVSNVLPVDVEIPGCPPPPLAILHGLLLAVGRKTSKSLISEPSEIKEK